MQRILLPDMIEERHPIPKYYRQNSHPDLMGQPLAHKTLHQRRSPDNPYIPIIRLQPFFHQLVEPLRAEFPEVDISEHVLQGPAGPALLTQAAGASLLVVGAQGRAAFPGMLVGSVAEYCVRNGPCPVVVVRTLPDAG